jgi:DNA-binding MltR family transcriptional regulator
VERKGAGPFYAGVRVKSVTDKKKFDLVEESDRGCVLVGAALLEERLEEMFIAVFKANKTPKKIQDSIFDSNGALSTFSAKIKMAYALGFIEKYMFEDLESIRRIRNDFAHSTKEVDFIGSNVADVISSMHCAQNFKGKMKRYSPKLESVEEDGPPEHVLRAMGYIKYTKSLFALGIKTLEIELLRATAMLKAL